MTDENTEDETPVTDTVGPAAEPGPEPPEDDASTPPTEDPA